MHTAHCLVVHAVAVAPTTHYVTVPQVEVVVGTKDVARDDRGKGAVVLPAVTLGHHVKEPLHVGEAVVALVGRSIVELNGALRSVNSKMIY